MKEQVFTNHRRLVPGYHYVLFLFTVAYIIGAIYYFITKFDLHLSRLTPILILLSAGIFSLTWFYARSFSLKAQDRAIRAEENLRHFALTGKLLDKKLRLGQIIALRFASDDEFVALAERAVKEDMSNNDIKKVVKNWRADNHRV